MIHTIVIPNKQTISFDIPKDYVGKQIEVIAFAKDEGIVNEKQAKKKVTFSALSIDTRGYKFNRDEANER
ncbi:hypothetical protein [Chitinophaga sp. LS1]|uniref:hypothetical protein n=1 Tax=Chitinophaga sp. LS1 TaxID=3051176 RepID=UPI002AAA8017|nr:hypothetical protein [Chitinophaga sp. LS1]WPV65961.1 hypothetical protein QQL36_29610 [Chitinophaga sp. LS1]